MQYTILIEQQDRDNDGGCGPGEQCRDAGAVGIHAEAVDQQRVAAEIDDVHQNGDEHRIPGIAHRPEHSGAALMNRQHGDGKRSDDQVFFTVGVDLSRDFTENQAEDCLVEKEQECAYRNAGQEHQPDQLIRTVAGVPFPLGSQILSGDDGSAGGHGGKDHDDQLHDLIHQ